MEKESQIKNNEEFISLSHLQSHIGKIAKGLSAGKRFILIRYSRPTGVILPHKEYSDLIYKLKQNSPICKKCKY